MQASYHLIPDSYRDRDTYLKTVKAGSMTWRDRNAKNHSWLPTIRAFGPYILIPCLGLAFILYLFILPPSPVIPDSPAACESLLTRREWRCLGRNEKIEYIRAVKCLIAQPSQLTPNGTLHDDFAWVHSRIGNYCE